MKTANELNALIEAGDAKGIVAFFKGMPEKNRRELVKSLLPSGADRSSMQWSKSEKVRHRYFLKNIAILATAGLGQLRKMSFDQPVPNYQLTPAAVEILSDRRPDWLQKWVNHLSDQWLSNWMFIQKLIDANLCVRPEGTNFVPLLINSFDSYIGRESDNIGLRQAIIENPVILDSYVWEFFENEEAGNRLQWHDEYAGRRDDMSKKNDGNENAHKRWDFTLVENANSGRISRDRLINAALDGMALDRPKPATWYASVHSVSAPTLSERAKRVERYLRLISCRAPAAVEVALTSIQLLLDAGQLPTEQFLNAVGAGLVGRPKGTVKRWLKLVSAAGKDHKNRELVSQAAIEALSHESSDIQSAAIDILEDYPPSNSALRDQIIQILPQISSTQRDRLKQVLGTFQSVETAHAAGGDELINEAKAVQAPYYDLLGFDVLLKCYESGEGSVPAIPLDNLRDFRVPRLDPNSPFKAVESLDELIDVFLICLEGKAPTLDFERVLDGVSRLCDQRPDDLLARTSSLRKRANGIIHPTTVPFGPKPRPFSGVNPLCDLAGLALVWSDKAAPERGHLNDDLKAITVSLQSESQWWNSAAVWGSHPSYFFQSTRIVEIARRAANGKTWQLLASPTHRDRWIDPRVLVERMKSGSVEKIDFIQALLRLAPEHRATALNSASNLPAETGSALRYALGSSSESIGSTAEYWIAAARARSPYTDDLLVEAKHPNLGPNAGRALQVELAAKEWKSKGDHAGPVIVMNPAPKGPVKPEFPTVLLTLSYVSGWDSAIWPLAPEVAFTAQVRTLPAFIESIGSYWKGDWELLFDPDTPLTDLGQAMIVLGMALKGPDLSRLATDAMIQGISNGQIDGQSLGRAFTIVYRTTPIKILRWIKALNVCWQVSPLHAQVARLALESLLETVEEIPVPGLELLNELVASSRESVNSELLTKKLTQLSGAGKAVKLAKEILGVKKDPSASRRSAVLYALTNRLERMKRYIDWRRDM